MFEISLKEFVKTGYFGPVKLGIQKDEVIKYLGEPEWFGVAYSGILGYGRYEIFYNLENNIVDGIQNDWLRTSLLKKRKTKSKKIIEMQTYSIFFSK